MATSTAPITTANDEDLFGEDDDFDLARSGYVSQTDGDLTNRLLLIRPTGSGTRESKEKGQAEYEYIVCDVIVLDGSTTELMDEIPFEMEDFQLSGVNVVNTLKPKLKRGGRVLGRLVQRKAEKRSTLAWHLDEPTPADVAATKAYLKSKRA